MNGKLVTASDTEQSFRSNTTAVILAKPTQPSTPSGTENEYRPLSGDTLLLDSSQVSTDHIKISEKVKTAIFH